MGCKMLVLFSLCPFVRMLVSNIVLKIQAMSLTIIFWAHSVRTLLAAGNPVRNRPISGKEGKRWQWAAKIQQRGRARPFARKRGQEEEEEEELAIRVTIGRHSAGLSLSLLLAPAAVQVGEINSSSRRDFQS